MMDIDDINALLKKACDHAEKKLGLTIKPGSFGVESSHSKIEPSGSGRCCPIGALELYLKQSRSVFEFNYDSFVDGFDADIDELVAVSHCTGWQVGLTRELFWLGREFRKQYVKEAPHASASA
jgi:hypothetical protein